MEKLQAKPEEEVVRKSIIFNVNNMGRLTYRTNGSVLGGGFWLNFKNILKLFLSINFSALT